MKLSTKGRYGLRAMVELALNYQQGQITLRTIAEKQKVSESYLEQLLISLKKAGLVSSTRGHQGGYILSKNPNEITVAMVMDVLEGTLAPIHCVDENPPIQCARFDSCAMKFVWKKVKDSIYEVLNSITLTDIANEQEQLDKQLSIQAQSETKSNSEFSTIVIKHIKKDTNNIAFRGKWLLEKERASRGIDGSELTFSVAITEKGNLVVLYENNISPENNGYSIFSTFDELKESPIVPQEIVNLTALSLNPQDNIVFLDI